ncbi:hypothetical protein PCASD_09034 [Puccinia coronata f. sp. avenae]|uniref:Uncharacterized protein n=1 Tax=Puccinia coronata f. sp. avenae TaxID=200324 RepID=A0A2N5UIM8_9BASI|nr:hypothetical protein PCASD_09034 [Puccinia coronata f. sp. avenae]
MGWPTTHWNSNCEGSAGQCLVKVYHQACTTAFCHINLNQETDWGILRHVGHHNHPWPESKKPDALSKGLLMYEVMKNPGAGAFKLKLGKPNASKEPFKSVTKIHGLFVNSDCLAYYRRLMLADLGIVPDKHGAGVGDKFINNMFHWNKRGLLIISSSFMEESKHFTFQTKWMAERLVSCKMDNSVYQAFVDSGPQQKLLQDTLCNPLPPIHGSVLYPS